MTSGAKAKPPAKGKGSGGKATKKRIAPKAARNKPPLDEWELLPLENAFCHEYIVDKNGTQAAIRAGYSPRTAASQASRLLRRVNVKRYIDHLLAEAAKRAEVNADEVIQAYARVMRADPRELMQGRRHCCRYCWGKGFLYQYTPAEWRDALADNQRRVKEAEEKGKPGPTLDPAGGVGYDKRKPPNPECPECWGEGHYDVLWADTRNLSPEAAQLYAGIKVTKDGMQILTEDRERAREMLGKHLGLFKEQVELSAADELVSAILRGRQRAGGKQD